MPHIHEIDDLAGDLVDLHYFRNDWCHRAWCLESGVNYAGWNGCHELISDDIVPCHQCGNELNVIPETVTPDLSLTESLALASKVIGPMIQEDILRIDGRHR